MRVFQLCHWRRPSPRPLHSPPRQGKQHILFCVFVHNFIHKHIRTTYCYITSTVCEVNEQKRQQQQQQQKAQEKKRKRKSKAEAKKKMFQSRNLFGRPFSCDILKRAHSFDDLSNNFEKKKKWKTACSV